jgi:hypothetical protein
MGFRAYRGAAAGFLAIFRWSRDFRAEFGSAASKLKRDFGTVGWLNAPLTTNG